MQRLRHAVVNVDAGLCMREGSLEPLHLSLADGQPTLEEGPVDRLRARRGGERAAPVVVTWLGLGLALGLGLGLGLG